MQVPTVTIPVKPGRSLAIIIEVAAMNNRQKKMGFNAAKAFTEQLDAHFGLGGVILNAYGGKPAGPLKFCGAFYKSD